MAWIEEVKDRKTKKIIGHRVVYRIGATKVPGPTFATKGEAKAALPKFAAIEASKKTLTATRLHSEIPLIELIPRYLDLRLARKKLKSRYYAERKRDLERIVKDGGWIATADITVPSVEAWVTKKDGKGLRSAGYLCALLRWAANSLEQGVCQKALKVLAPPQSKQSVHDRPLWEVLDTWRLRAAAQGPHGEALFYMLVTYGGRCMALGDMKVRDFDAREGVVYNFDVKKSGDIGYPIDPQARFLLARIVIGRSPDEPLFLDPRTDKGWNATKGRSAMVDWWHFSIDSRKGFQIRNLKYEAMSHMDEMGLSASEIAMFTGHKTISQVNRYLRSNPVSKRAALAKLFPAKPEEFAGANQGQTLQHDENSRNDESYKPLPALETLPDETARNAVK